METDKITVLIVEPEKKPYVKEIESGLESLQHEVGGYIQAIYPFEDPVGIICDEEGKLKGYPLNRALRDEQGDVYDILAGTFLIAGLGEEDFASLSQEYIDKYTDMYRNPEIFFQMGEKLVVIPVKEQKVPNEKTKDYEREDR